MLPLKHISMHSGLPLDGVASDRSHLQYVECAASATSRRGPSCFPPSVAQSQNDPFVGSSAKSFPSWQRYRGTPERTICFIRIRVSDIALALQSQGIGIIASNPSF